MVSLPCNMLIGCIFTFTIGSTKASEPHSCGCALRCYDKVSEDQRQALFDGFWSSCDYNTQNAYLCGCIKTIEVKRRYTDKGTSSRQKNSRVYYVDNESATSVRICRTAFLRMHAVSGGRLDRALKARTGRSLHMDMRGRHSPTNKTSERFAGICEGTHRQFPTV